MTLTVARRLCKPRFLPFRTSYRTSNRERGAVDNVNSLPFPPNAVPWIPSLIVGGSMSGLSSAAGTSGGAKPLVEDTDVDAAIIEEGNVHPNFDGKRGMRKGVMDLEMELAVKDLERWKFLAERSPGFAVKGSSIKVITCPTEFYTTIMKKISEAKERISLASLYLGNGSLEKDMVEAIKTAVTHNPDLKVKVLLDYTRGSRGEDNSRKMLLPVIKQSSACQLYLYHTPTLRGLVKRWLPPRWNEVIGLQHMKIYLFDNTVLISGANLSNDYFTNRQDRYLLIEDSKDIVDFFDGLVSEVTGFSFKVDSKNEVSLQPGWKIHPSEGDLDEFVKRAKSSITSFYEDWKLSNPQRLQAFLVQSNLSNSSEDTWIFPLIQMGALNISLDHEATCEVFKRAPESSTIKLATGYFNLTTEYINTIINESSSSYEILMAHPKANGFLGARGFAGGIPAAYTQLAKKFFENVQSQGQQKRISMWEYIRPKWTFHAKGLWYYPTGAKLPVLTLVGSPNFGYRSVHRDLETQLYLITLNKELRLRLHEEQNNVFEMAKPFSSLEIVKPERQVPVWVRMVIMFFRNFF